MPHPRLTSLATAVPPHILTQDDVQRRAAVVFQDSGELIERLAPVYVNAGIDRRYSCVPLDWYGSEHSWSARNTLFVDNATNLMAEAATVCLERADLSAADVDGVVVVSTTGVATPSLDALLIQRLGLPARAKRLPIFGLGCAGGVVGLARAAALASAEPGSRVLFLVAELCALTFRHGDRSKSNIVATALFGDGAAAVLLSSDGGGPRIGFSAEHTWPDTLDVMGWGVEDDGLRVVFSRDIPALIRTEFRAVLDAVLAERGLDLCDFDSFLCHPGGAKVLDALEDVLGLPSGGLDHSRAVLRDYGNMSAVTVLFVLERVLAAGGLGRRALMTALGPGFTAGFLTLEDTAP